MTNDEKKEYLKSYRRAKTEARSIEESIMELRTNKMYPSICEQDGMPHGSGGSDLSGYAARLDELERRLQAKKWECINLYHQIMADIMAMPEATERTLLQYRYISGWTWERIAVEMDFTYRWVLKLHGKALNNFKTVHCNSH